MISNVIAYITLDIRISSVAFYQFCLFIYLQPFNNPLANVFQFQQTLLFCFTVLL